MSEEWQRVLKMLESGRVTVEQANQLLEALGEEQSVRGSERPTPSQPASRSIHHQTQRTPRFTTAQLIQLSNHGVDASFIREMVALGYNEMRFDDLIRLSDHDI